MRFTAFHLPNQRPSPRQVPVLSTLASGAGFISRPWPAAVRLSLSPLILTSCVVGCLSSTLQRFIPLACDLALAPQASHKTQWATEEPTLYSRQHAALWDFGSQTDFSDQEKGAFFLASFCLHLHSICILSSLLPGLPRQERGRLSLRLFDTWIEVEFMRLFFLLFFFFFSAERFYKRYRYGRSGMDLVLVTSPVCL